jgi:hypothetical protein
VALNTITPKIILSSVECYDTGVTEIQLSF